MELGVRKYDASYLLSAIGISSLIGKIGLGLISDRPWINRLYLYCICVGTCGLSEILSSSTMSTSKEYLFILGLIVSNFCIDYSSQIIFCIIYGGTSGGYLGLTSVVLIDVVGIEKFIQACGIQLFCMGIATTIGPPIIGKITMLLFKQDKNPS